MLATLFLLGQTNAPGEPRRTFAAGPKDAYVMLPPQTVCGARAAEMAWAADGSTLVVRRETTEASAADLAALAYGRAATPEVAARLRRRRELVTWSVRSGKVATALSLAGEGAEIGELTPMPGGDRVVFSTYEKILGTNGEPDREATGVSMLLAASGSVVRLDESPDGQYDAVEVSDKRPLGEIMRLGGPSTTPMVRFFGPNGMLGPWLPLPPHVHAEFEKDGGPVLSTVALGADGKRHLRRQRVDPATGRLGDPYEAALYGAGAAAPPPTLAKAPPVVPPLSVEADPSIAARPHPAAPAVFLRAKDGKPDEAGVVTTDGTEPLLSPRFDAVAYVSGGSAVVRPIVRVDRAAYEVALVEAARALAISNAKQAALGVLMYAGDNDDMLPVPADYEKIYPYLKDRGIVDSFTYSFAGGKQTDIDEVASTVMGYVSGPGGRAVAYTDGHVKWIPDGS